MFFLLILTIISLCSAQNGDKELILRDTLIYLGILNRIGCDALLKIKQSEGTNIDFLIQSIKCGHEIVNSLANLDVSLFSLSLLHGFTTGIDNNEEIEIIKNGNFIDSVAVDGKFIKTKLKEESDIVLNRFKETLRKEKTFVLNYCQVPAYFMNHQFENCFPRNIRQTKLRFYPKSFQNQKKERTYKPKRGSVDKIQLNARWQDQIKALQVETQIQSRLIAQKEARLQHQRQVIQPMLQPQPQSYRQVIPPPLQNQFQGYRQVIQPPSQNQLQTAPQNGVQITQRPQPLPVPVQTQTTPTTSTPRKTL